jgi:hypothetical protein
MTRTFRARFEGGKLVPEEPILLPSDQVLVVQVRTAGPDASNEAPEDMNDLVALAERLDRLPENPASPGDLSSQHDHYLYGTPKRENP